mmetsp:Transcript_4805/g.8236  ORF Transcript_4805/g.8236 Transcript_4805/m.8236 type:complete len:216 (+) Transcript_4805:321-968(+)
MQFDNANLLSLGQVRSREELGDDQSRASPFHSNPNLHQSTKRGGLLNMTKINSAIQEEDQNELFFTTDNKFQLLNQAPSQARVKRGSIANGVSLAESLDLNGQAKCICFCEQKHGRQQKCTHQFSTDIDEISKIVQEQARDFTEAERYTAEDIAVLMTGLTKVEFVRSENYLSQLAVLVARQEKEILRLKLKETELRAAEEQNQQMAARIKQLEA